MADPLLKDLKNIPPNDPFLQEPRRNSLDDIIEQAQQDLELERQRQEAIITAEEPDKVLGSINKVEKQIENESPEVQKSVRQKAYQPGYFDLSRTIDTMAVSKPKEKDNKAIDEMFDDYFKYQEKFPIYYEEIFNQLLKEKLGTVKEPARTTTMKGERWSYPKIMYGEEHLEVEARKLAKERLAQEGLIKPAKTGLGTLKEIVSDPKEFARRLPFVGGGIETQEALELLSAIKDAKNGTADEEDYQLLIEAQMEAEREGNFGALVAEIATQLPAYAIEFSTTAGTASAGKEAVKRSAREAVNWMLKKQGKKIIKEGAEKFGLRAVQGAVGTTAGAFARTLDPRMLPRIMSNTSKQLLPDFEINKRFDDQIEVVSEEIKPFGKALSEGFMLTFTENLGEQFGDTFGFAGKELTKFVKANPKSVVSGVIKAIVRKNPKVPPGKIMQGVRQAGIHSVPVEIFEERVTDFLQSGIEGHEFKWPTPEEWLAEIVAIGFFAGGAGAVGSAVDYRTRKKQEKAKTKGLEAIETGQLRQLSDQDIADFVRSLTPEERMEVGIGEDGQFEVESDLGKEVVRRNLDMDKYPETEAEFREANARANIKRQQIEGKDFVGKLIEKAESESGVKIEREFLDRTLADEIEQEDLSEERVKQILKDHGIDENTDPKKIMITGKTSGHIVRISTAGTSERMAEEFVAVSEEMAEVYYNAEVENQGEEFINEVQQDRKNYYKATGEKDTGESDLEWFSSMALRFATQGKVHRSIGAKLTDIFNELIEYAKRILIDSKKLEKAIKEGKVSESLISKLEEATDFKTVGKKVKQAKKIKQVAKIEGRKATPDGGVSYRISEVGKVDPVGVFVIGADMVARDLDGKLDPFGLRYTENYNGFALSKAGATKLVKNGQKGFNTVAVIAYDKIKESQIANPSFQNRVKEKLVEAIGKRRLNKLLKENNDDVKKVSGIVNKEIQEANKNKAKKDKKEKINMEAIALDNAEPDSPQLRRKIVYVGTLKEIRTGEDRFRKHDVYPAEQIFDTLVELKEPIPIDDLVADLPDTDFRKKGWGMMVTQTNFMMTADESNIAQELIKMGQEGKDVFTGTPNPDYQFYSSETDQTLTAEEAISKSGDEKEFKSRQFVSQLDEQLGLGTATRGSVGISEKYGNESAIVTRFFGKQKQELLDYRGAWTGLMFDQIEVTNFIGDDNGKHSLLKITIDKTDLIHLNEVMQNNGILSQTIRIRGNKQDILLWDKGDINTKLVHAIAEDYNAKEYTKQKGEFKPLTNESDRKEARKAFIKIIQDYQSKTDIDIPKAFTKFLPDFYKRKSDQEQLLKQLKAKPKATYRLTPTFYSQAERVVTDKFPPTMKSQSVENFLKKNQVKPEEIEWLDLESLLKGKLKITKEELQEWIQANKIDVQDVTFGQYKEDPKAKKQLIKLYEKRSQELGWFVNQTTKIKIKGYEDKIVDRFKLNQVVIIGEGASTKITENLYDGKINPIGYFNNKNYEVYGGVQNSLEYTHRLNSLYNLEKEINELESKEAKMREKKDTEYESYQLPGDKEDYRELLLTLPPRPMTFEEFDADAKSIGLTDQQVIKNQYVDYLKDPGKDISKDKNFKTSHFKQPNILAHVRFNTRISPTGERILFIEELQSDWHKEGREKGYITKWEIPESWKWKNENIANQMVYSLYNAENVRVKFGSTKAEVIRELKKENSGVPNAPFKGNGWIELIMKRMLRHASDNNFDRIAWTTSNQQIDRWRNDLRQNVDQIQWQKQIPQIKSFEQFYKEDQEFMEGIDRDISREGYEQYVKEESDVTKDMVPSVIINGLKNKENKFNQTIPLEGETTINGQRVTLEGLLGKQMATQIRNSNKRTGIIEGDDLTIGGQGFKVVYDFAISKILNKMGKKFGASVDQVDIATEKGTIPKDIVERIKRLSFKRTDIQEKLIVAMNAPSQLSPEDRQSYIDELNDQKEKLNDQIQKLRSKYKNVMIDNAQPSIKITRKMKEFALKGQPTFRASKMSSTEEVLDSPSFKKWFKGSKVVDEQGKPLVVYHGTTAYKEIEEFDDGTGSGGIYFSDNQTVAEDYGHQIIPVYLSFKNPFIIDIKGQRFEKAVFDKTLLNGTRFEGQTFENAIDWLSWKYKSDDWNNKQLRVVNDGVILKNIIDPHDQSVDTVDESDVYIAFKNNQIKSVFNKGTFNPNDPRISFRLSPKNIVTPLAKVYQEQKGNKKSYTKKDWEQDLARLGYDEDMIKSAMDMFGIIRMKQIDTTDPTPIEKELKKLQEREIKKSEIKNRIKRAYRLGATEKEKEITKLQKIVTNYARQNLPKGLYQKSEVTGILAKVRDAKRFRELSTAMERIDRVIDKVSKRGALAKWNKTIKKKATVKKVGGIGRGKVGADVQEIVNQIRDIHKKSPVEIENKIDVLTQIMEASEDGEATDSQALEINILLQYGSMKNKTPQEIIEAIEKFDTLVTQGRMQIMEEQMAYSERMSNVRQEILDVITGGAGAQTQAGAQKLGLKDQGIIKEIVESLSGFETQQQSLEYLFDKLSRLDKTSKPLQSFINNYFMPQIRQARLAEYNGVVEMHKLMRENAERIFKVKDTIFNKALTKLFNRNSIETITITHRDGAEGEMTSSDLTYNQAYKKWMELKDPTLYKTFEKMGWDIQKTKNQIEQQLPKEVLAWAEWQLYEFYPMYYHRVNETFRSRFYVNMPMNAMYSPIARRIGAKADEGDDTLNKSKSPLGSMSSAGSLKGRVSNTEELAWIDGDNTLMKHITEMEHFIHYTNVMRELRSVFMSRDVSRSVQDFHGKNISRTLNKFMDDIARGGVDRAMHLEWADKWRAKVTRATIGLNEVVFIKQLTSIPAYWGDMPIISWHKEVLMSIGAFEFKKAYRTLSKSDMIKMRYDKGFERDMVLALNNIKPGKMMTGSDWLNNVAFFLTKMGDKTAIFLGGWPLYKYEYKKALKEGKTKKEAEDIAMKKFEASTKRAQQASDPEDLSDFQRMGSAWKFFTMYMTSPNQYYRMSAGGVRNIYYGRGTKAENLRRIFVGWFLLPQLFTFVANGFEIDEDEQLISLLTGPFVGLMFVGQGIEHSIRMAFGKEYRSGSVALLDIFNDFGRMFKTMFNGKEFETKKILSIIDDFLKGSSKAPLVGGFPYAPVKRSITSKIKVIKGESDNPIREAVGFKFKKKKKKPKRVTAEPTFSN